MNPRHSLLTAAAALLLTTCVVGAPPGFSDGDSWTFPLVAPLENDLLMVPVKINGTGPYLFMIDPDSNVSSIDTGIANDLKLYTVQAANEELNENDRKVPVFLSEVKSVEVGPLKVRNQKLRVHKFGTFWSGGRRVRGILGRDIIADSLVFSADRDRGVATLATQGNLKPPAGAASIGYRRFYFRRLAKVNVNGMNSTLHVDLASRVSQLWPEKLEALSLPSVAVRATFHDEYGAPRQVQSGVLSPTVVVGAVSANQILFVPYGDGRMDKTDLDGVLGLNFLSKFHVTANWHKATIWLAPRTADRVASAPERIARWGGVFAGCQNPGCVEVVLLADGRPVVPKAGGEPKTFPKPPPPPTPNSAPTPGTTPPGAGTPGQSTGPTIPGVKTVPARQPSQPDPNAQPKPAPVPPQPIRQPPPPADFTLQITRDPRMADVSFEVLLEAVGPDDKSLGLPLIWVAMQKGAGFLAESSFDANFAVASKFAVVDVGPFPRECANVGGKKKCVWVRPLAR